MWRNVDLVMKTQAVDTFKLFQLCPILDYQLPQFNCAAKVETARRVLYGIFEACREEYRLTEGMPAEIRHNRVNGVYLRQLMDLVRRIETLGQFELVALIYSLCDALRVHGFMATGLLDEVALANPTTAAGLFFGRTARLIHFFLGDETRMLVGAKDNKPAWLPYKKRITSFREAEALDLPVGAQMVLIGQDDLEFVAPPTDQDEIFAAVREVPEAPSFRQMLELLENAHANLRYVPNPAGSLVKFGSRRPGAGLLGFPLRSILLKVTPSPTDETSFGFLAKLELTSGGFVTYGIGDIMFSIEAGLENPDECIKRFRHGDLGLFCFWVCIQVYHDLVTAKRIATQRPDFATDRKKKKREAEPEFPNPDRPWIYIPRVIHGQVQGIRKPVLESREPYTPREVRMHTRDVPMSGAQMEEIIAFEAQYGLKVLRYIDPGSQTIVKAYVSPELSEVERRRLPRYILARWQLDLTEQLREKHKKDTSLLERSKK